MNNKPLKKNKDLLKVARILRSNMTKQERHLWYDFLQRYPIKIYKQRIIDNFVVDFYCHKARLVIELDGSQHFSEQGQINDEQRSAILKSYGIEILRFSNKDVNENFEGVCFLIDKTIKDLIENNL